MLDGARRCRASTTPTAREAMLGALEFVPLPDDVRCRRCALARPRAGRGEQLGLLAARLARAAPGCSSSSTAWSPRPRSGARQAGPARSSSARSSSPGARAGRGGARGRLARERRGGRARGRHPRRAAGARRRPARRASRRSARWPSCPPYSEARCRATRPATPAARPPELPERRARRAGRPGTAPLGFLAGGITGFITAGDRVGGEPASTTRRDSAGRDRRRHVPARRRRCVGRRAAVRLVRAPSRARGTSACAGPASGRAVGWAALGMVSLLRLRRDLLGARVDPDVEQTVTEDLGADEGTFGLIAAGLHDHLRRPVLRGVLLPRLLLRRAAHALLGRRGGA